MLTRTNFWRTAAVVGLLLNGCLLAFFLTRPHVPPRGERPRKIIAERLHFDAGQVAAYEKLIGQHRLDIRAKEEEIQAAKRQLYSLLQGNDFSAKDSLTSRIGQLQVEIENIHFNHFKDLKQLCKGGQIKDFDALASELAGLFASPGKQKKQPGQ